MRGQLEEQQGGPSGWDRVKVAVEDAPRKRGGRGTREGPRALGRALASFGRNQKSLVRGVTLDLGGTG